MWSSLPHIHRHPWSDKGLLDHYRSSTPKRNGGSKNQIKNVSWPSYSFISTPQLWCSTKSEASTGVCCNATNATVFSFGVIGHIRRIYIPTRHLQARIRRANNGRRLHRPVESRSDEVSSMIRMLCCQWWWLSSPFRLVTRHDSFRRHAELRQWWCITIELHHWERFTN